MNDYLLYCVVAGLIYASWLYDVNASNFVNVLNIGFGLLFGWIVTPILIGRTIAQIYKG